MPALHSIICRVTHQFTSTTADHTAYAVHPLSADPPHHQGSVSLHKVRAYVASPCALLLRKPSVREKDMTGEQEQMLRAVLRNQEVIMNALADLLTGDPRNRQEEQSRDNTLADLGTCVGLTHYHLQDLRQLEQPRAGQNHPKT